MPRTFQTPASFHSAKPALFAALAVLALMGLTSEAHATLTITGKPTQNVSCSAGVCSATAADAVLNAGDLRTMLASSNVQVVSTNIAKNIAVNAALTWISSNTLTLDAARSITIRKPISVAGTGGLTLTTNDGSTGGVLFFSAAGKVTFWSLTSSLTIDGNAYTLINDIATLASDVTANPNGFYALANSYDATADGTYAHAPVKSDLYGTFEGLGNTISNLNINDQSNESVVGLFDGIQSTGTVQNVGLLNVNITGTYQIGALVGENYGTIRNVFATGAVSTGLNGTIGGLVGTNEYMKGEIYLSHADVTVTSRGAAGGLAGINANVIAQSYAMGSVSGILAGGLIGVNSAQISQCYATGAVSGEEAAGGLIGQSSGATIAQTYEIGTISGSGLQGGLIGSSDNGIGITYSYWDTTTTGRTGKKSGIGDHRYVPGIVGMSSHVLKSALPSGFDPTVWGQNAKINGGFPYLLAIPPT